VDVPEIADAARAGTQMGFAQGDFAERRRDWNANPAPAARSCECWKKFYNGEESKNQAAAIRFGPALKASFSAPAHRRLGHRLCLAEERDYRLGQQIRQRDKASAQLQNDNKRLGDQIAMLRSPVMLIRRAKELNLGLAPQPAPSQVSYAPLETSSETPRCLRQFAQRSTELTP
jgi:hypothetical protein